MDVEARNAEVERWMPLVRQIARSICKKSAGKAEYDDLVSDGAIGLMRAVERFDPSLGNSFQTFAAWRIRGAMQDGLRERDHLSRADRHRASLGETVGVRETLYECDVADRSECVEMQEEDLRFRAMVFRGLSELQQAVVDMRYFAGMRMRDIGQTLGISESRISQVHSEALAHIRNRLKGRRDLLT